MYNAIIVLLMAIDDDGKMKKLIETYSEMRDEGNQKYEEDNKSGVISEKQGKNFTTMEELNSKKRSLTVKEKKKINKTGYI